MQRGAASLLAALSLRAALSVKRAATWPARIAWRTSMTVSVHNWRPPVLTKSPCVFGCVRSACFPRDHSSTRGFQAQQKLLPRLVCTLTATVVETTQPRFASVFFAELCSSSATPGRPVHAAWAASVIPAFCACMHRSLLGNHHRKQIAHPPVSSHRKDDWHREMLLQACLGCPSPDPVMAGSSAGGFNWMVCFRHDHVPITG